MGRDNSLELERDIKYLKSILDNYSKTLSERQKNETKNSLKKRYDFIVGQIKNVFN